MNLSKIAKESIRLHFEGKLFEPDSKIKNKYSNKGASFVTITLNGKLRGCVGTLPFRKKQELWKDVRDNSINAAFRDVRFRPLTKEEFNLQSKKSIS